MKNKNKAKGVFVVEFALTLPMYLGVTFSVIFGSLMLHDEYVLQTTTQTLAREFAIDAASTVQTNAQTGIVYGNAVNSILKYRKTLDDKLYLYKTTNEQGKQCTISIECNARNVSGSIGSGQTYNMYKLDSAYIVLKGKVVPKKDMIPQMVQFVCPNLLDTMRKTRVELNINASLISKMAFDSGGGSADGILHSEEYTADYGDYNLNGGNSNGDTSVDNKPDLTPANTLIQAALSPDTSTLASYSDSYKNNNVIEAKDFESMLYDLFNEDGLNKILWDRLINSSDIPNLINDLYKLGLLQTNKIDFLYSIYTDGDAAKNWQQYVNEYLKNYFGLGPLYTFNSGSMKLLTISKENKSALTPDTSSLLSLLGLGDEVDLTMGKSLETYQYLIGQVTVKNTVTGVQEVYNVVFKAGDELTSMIMKDYVADVQTATNNGLQMASVGKLDKTTLPDDGGTIWKESNKFFTDNGAVNADQYEGLYKSVNNVYYELNDKAVIEQTGINKFADVYYDQTNTSSPAYVKQPIKVDGVNNNYYIPLDNVASGVTVESNSWNKLYCDLTGSNQGTYASISSEDKVASYICVNAYNNPVAYDSSSWKSGFYVDGNNTNEGVYLKVNGTVDGVKADRYFKLADVNAGFSVSEGSKWVLNPDGTYRDDAGVKAGNYVKKDNLYYLVDDSSSPAATTSGRWYNLYHDITNANEGVYAKVGNDVFQVNANGSVTIAASSSAWTEMRYDSTQTNEGLYRYLGNAYYKVADNVVANVVQNNTSQWTNFKVDTLGGAEGLYIANQSAYFQVKNPNVGVTNQTWINSSTTNNDVYLDANSQNTGNNGTYAVVNGKVNDVQQNYYYKLKDAASDIGKDTPAANALTNGADNIRVGTDGKKYALIGNSYYELADDAKPLTATDGTWKSAVFDTRRPHAHDDRTYYKNTIKLNGVNVDYFTEIDPVGVLGARGTDGKLLNTNEAWNLIYFKSQAKF